jgi:23S rRNA (adenine2503-C2)-methyltransferase
MFGPSAGDAGAPTGEGLSNGVIHQHVASAQWSVTALVRGPPVLLYACYYHTIDGAMSTAFPRAGLPPDVRRRHPVEGEPCMRGTVPDTIERQPVGGVPYLPVARREGHGMRPVLPALTDLKDLTLPQLQTLLDGLGAESYRARQICRWVFKAGVPHVAEMTDVPKPLRDMLEQCTQITTLMGRHISHASDGTRKLRYHLSDGAVIESVLIREPRRLTLCLSTQAGCRMGCAFCLTAKGGLRRHLRPAEIVDQIIQARTVLHPGEQLTNLVLMGMGEPLDNYAPTVTALRIITDPEALAFSPRRITVSTSGLVPAIRKFGAEGLGVNLAVSLNAPHDALRTRLMPINKKWPIRDLLAACRDYPLPHRRRITFEYVLLAGLNDQPNHAEQVAALLRDLRCKVNLIPFNEFPGAAFRRPAPAVVQRFQAILLNHRLTATIRESRGREIGAACGQLAEHASLSPFGLDTAPTIG